jgi:hypothetical protein
MIFTTGLRVPSSQLQGEGPIPNNQAQKKEAPAAFKIAGVQ